MFIETHLANTESGIPLAFVKSLNVQAYPCGRRRSELVDKDGVNTSVEDRYYIPFDPEARLNTEANNRKYSSLNGFTQTYLNKWDIQAENLLSLVLSGYLFDIKLDEGFRSTNEFGSKLVTALNESTEAKYIYANIRIEEIPLFEGFTSYNTGVLRDQASTDIAETNIDLLNTSAKLSNNLQDKQAPENYYFSGLSFSASPLSEDSSATASIKNIYNDNGTVYQRIVSLRILEKTSDGWQTYQPALLPKVEHGDTEGSVKVKTVIADSIQQDGGRVPALSVEETTEGSGIYRLHFSYGK